MVKNQLTLTFTVNPRGDFDKGVHEHRFIIFRRVRTIAENNYYLRQSVRLEQLGSHWTDLHEI
jgi:hypothetical protein